MNISVGINIIQQTSKGNSLLCVSVTCKEVFKTFLMNLIYGKLQNGRCSNIRCQYRIGFGRNLESKYFSINRGQRLSNQLSLGTMHIILRKSVLVLLLNLLLTALYINGYVCLCHIHTINSDALEQVLMPGRVNLQGCHVSI